MTNPAECSPTSYPKTRRDDQPEKAAQELAIIDLPNSRDDQTENSGVARFAHSAYPSCVNSKIRCEFPSNIDLVVQADFIFDLRHGVSISLPWRASLREQPSVVNLRRHVRRDPR
jgi:hypothetical protein